MTVTLRKGAKAVKEPKRTPLIRLSYGQLVRTLSWVDSGRDSGLVDDETWIPSGDQTAHSSKRITPSQALDALVNALKDGWTTNPVEALQKERER